MQGQKYYGDTSDSGSSDSSDDDDGGGGAVVKGSPNKAVTNAKLENEVRNFIYTCTIDICIY